MIDRPTEIKTYLMCLEDSDRYQLASALKTLAKHGFDMKKKLVDGSYYTFREGDFSYDLTAYVCSR